MNTEMQQGIGPTIKAAGLSLVVPLILAGSATSLLFGGGTRGYLQALLGIVVGVVGAFGGFLLSKPDRCPRCKRITEVAEDVSGVRRCAPCWLDEMGRPRKP